MADQFFLGSEFAFCEKHLREKAYPLYAIELKK